MRRALTIACLMVVGGIGARGVQAQDRPDFHVTRAPLPPKIDGVLDDEVWQQLPPMALGEWLSYNPNRGDKMAPELRTDIRVAYDDRNLYFAFHCVDNEPDKIRTTVSRRDQAFNDDWIAISLDSAATGQAAYHLFVNPSGSQMDALNTTASGEQFDADFVWYAVAKTTSDGYDVEVQVPLQTLRFASGDNVTMGILFFRKISRLGISYSFPTLPPGQWVFDRHAHLRFDRLTQPRLVEALPSVTYGVNQTRATVDRWDPLDGKPDFGISGKFGITSNITLDGTINPDFSQVESDAFQVEVNQRFPIFFSEKRPFFMEGMGLFNVAGTGGDSNMRTAVHTRKIINPLWGSKITGTIGKTTFGVLNALDQSPGDDDIVSADRPLRAGEDKFYTIARATYALRKADYVGAIATDTEHAGRSNRVAGGDIFLKPSPSQVVTATFLATQTRSDGTDSQGNAVQSQYNFETRRFVSYNQFEHYDRGFQMDTAFYNRAGFTSFWTYEDVSFYPKARGGGDFWLQRVHPFAFLKRGYDESQRGNEFFANTGVRFNWTRQGFGEISRSSGYETWVQQRFTTGRDINAFALMQVFRWLNVDGGYNTGPATYYDPLSPYQGHLRSRFFGTTVQPDQHLSFDFNVDNQRFERPSTGARVYDVTIANIKTTYQFDKHFLVRLLEQFDSSTHRFLTDLLASYELVPGTVFHAGYGSLYQRNGTPAGALATDGLGQQYVLVNRGLFFKASYLHRF